MNFNISNKFNKKSNLIDNEDLELDMQLDTKGIVLEKPVYCAYCMTTTTKIEHNKYRCPSCHITFNEAAA